MNRIHGCRDKGNWGVMSAWDLVVDHVCVWSGLENFRSIDVMGVAAVDNHLGVCYKKTYVALMDCSRKYILLACVWGDSYWAAGTFTCASTGFIAHSRENMQLVQKCILWLWKPISQPNLFHTSLKQPSPIASTCCELLGSVIYRRGPNRKQTHAFH